MSLIARLSDELRSHPAFGRALWLSVPTLLLCAVIPGVAALAHAQEPKLQPAVVTVMQAPTPMVTKTVWEGEDVDGDGAADFTNPTGGEPRTHDAFGDGWFGAVRDRGSRPHEGVDYTGQPGQTVVAPIAGLVTKIGQAYADSSILKFVELTNPATGYVARVFYVFPAVSVGQTIALGQSIGDLASLQFRYPGITNHVHLELMNHTRRFDATRVIYAETVTEPATAVG